MDRVLIYSLEQIRAQDQANFEVYPMIGLAGVSQALLGKTDTVVSGFAATQTVSPSLTVNIAAGMIYQLEDVDDTQFGPLPANTDQIMQQGFYAASTVNVVNATGSGQSQYILIQATFDQADDDPEVLPYVNIQNPSQPLNGPAGSNIPQDTVRKGVATVSVKSGVAATTGTQVPPNPDSGYVPLYLILLAFGQTTITDGQIQIAGPDVYAGYEEAPFCPGLTGVVPGRTGSHHHGVAGEANKIDLTTEADGIAPFSVLPVSNTDPPGVGGIVVEAGEIPIISQTDDNPNGNLAGNANDLVYDQVHGIMYVCVTSGSDVTAVWQAVGNPGTIIETSTTPLIPVPGFIYFVDSTGGDKVVNSPAAADCFTLPISVVNVGANTVTVTCQTGEQIDGTTNGTIVLSVQGDRVKLGPKTSGTAGFWQCP